MNSFYAVWLTVSGAVALLVAWLGWRKRAATGALALVALMLALAVWAFTYAFFWISVTPEARLFWLNMTYFGAVSAPVAFFVLTQYYIGRGDWLTQRAYVTLLTIPVLTLIFLWTDPLHGLFFGATRAADASMIFSGGPWFYVSIVYLYGLMAVGVVLLFRAHMLSNAFYRRQTRVMLIGGTLPWAVNILLLLGRNPLPGLDLTPLAFTGTGLLFAYAFFGFRMMDLVPVGRDVLVENLDEAIVVVDTSGIIVDINPKGLEYLEPGAESPLGRRFDEAFSRWAYLITRFASFEGRVEHKLEYPPYSHIELQILSLKDRQSRLAGKLIAWRDISARKQAEEKVRVFLQTVEQNPVVIMITDAEGYIEYTNPRFTALTGYSSGEARGRNPRFLQSGETARDAYAMLWNTIKAGKVWEGEIRNRKKNGELYWAYEMIAPVLNDQGLIINFVAMQQDITNSKRDQEKLSEVNARLQQKLAEVESLHAKLREEAIHDGLTRLYNRSYMEETLEREVSRVERDLHPISVVMMDVDLFKSINDTYGHQAGDAVLQTLGMMLLDNTRISDIACRYGGDEMLVVMPGATQEVAIARAEEWRTAFSHMEFNFGDDVIRTTLSLGVATFPDQARNPIELLTAADKALYSAKGRRNHVVSYEPSMMTRGGQFRSDNIQ